MSHSESPPVSHKGWIAAGIAICLLATLCGGPLTWWFARQSSAKAQLAERREEIQLRGLPIDNESLEDFRSENMPDEFSDRWMQILNAINREAFNESTTPIASFYGSSEYAYAADQAEDVESEIQAFLQQWAELRQEIHQVTEGSGAIWTAIHMESFNTLLPFVQSTRSVVRLLGVEFKDAVRRDDRQQAFRSLMAMFGTARTLEKEPVIISQLVHIAISGVALRHLKHAIELDLLDENQLLALHQQLRAFDDFGSRYRLAIAGERAMSQPVFDDIQNFSEELHSIPSGLNERPIDALASLDVYAKLEAIPTDNLTEFLAKSEQLDQEFEDQMQQAGFLRQMDTVLTGLIMPAIGGASRAFVRSAMEIRLAKLAIAASLFEKRHARFPESLDELLAADLAIDLGPVAPIGGLPYGYRRLDDHAQLWGFDPQNSNDQTPTEPPDLTTVDEGREDHFYWSWQLAPMAIKTAHTSKSPDSE